MTRWLAEFVENDTVAFRIGREGDTLVAEWIGMASLAVDRDGRNPRFAAEDGAYEADIEKIKRGSARLLLRHLEGKLALHGAAVCFDGRAVLLLGRSGQGKSTLAASLCTRGASLLSDDAIAIDLEADGSYSVQPFETNHWLDEAARAAVGAPIDGDWKLPVRARASSEAARLVAIVDLAYADASVPVVERLSSGLEAMALLVPQVVRFILDDAELQRKEFEALAQLVAAVPAFRLARPRHLAQLEASADAVIKLVRGER